jgi:hypothetical protein
MKPKNDLVKRLVFNCDVNTPDGPGTLLAHEGTDERVVVQELINGEMQIMVAVQFCDPKTKKGGVNFYPINAVEAI